MLVLGLVSLPFFCQFVLSASFLTWTPFAFVPFRTVSWAVPFFVLLENRRLVLVWLFNVGVYISSILSIVYVSDRMFFGPLLLWQLLLPFLASCCMRFLEFVCL